MGALVAAVLAYRNLREQVRLLKKANDKQDQELKAVQKDREREAEERRRAQAAQVFMTYEFGDRARKMFDLSNEPGAVRYLVTIVNSSSQPIYQVIVRWHDGSAPWMIDGEDTNQLDYVMHGQEKEISRLLVDGGNRAARGAVVDFTDAAGVRWQRRENGELRELSVE